MANLDISATPTPELTIIINSSGELHSMIFRG